MTSKAHPPTATWASPDGRATLYHGDALAVLAALDDASVDAVITDAPYSSGGMYRADRIQAPHEKYFGNSGTAAAVAAFAGDNRDQRGYAHWAVLWLAQSYRITRPGGVCLLWTDWRQLPATTDALQAGGWIWRGIIPWTKPDPRPQAGRFTNAAEYVVWGSRGALPIVAGAPCLPGIYHARAPRGEHKHHLVEKPLEVLRALVRIVPSGSIVLDPFSGSGSTGVAALAEGRQFIGVEITNHYTDVATARLAEACLQPTEPNQLDLFTQPAESGEPKP